MNRQADNNELVRFLVREKAFQAQSGDNTMRFLITSTVRKFPKIKGQILCQIALAEARSITCV